MTDRNDQLLVLGIGNVLMGDEGVGVRVVQHLQYLPLPPGVECLVGTLARLVVQRTFEAMIATPVSIEDVIAAEALYGAAKGLVHATAVGITIALFGLLPSPWALWT